MESLFFCQGLTAKGTRCRRKLVSGTYCYNHAPPVPNLEKSEECPICCETSPSSPLECGHWIHLSCIERSMKAECPICRAPLHLSARSITKITKNLRQYHTDLIVAEQDQIRRDLRLENIQIEFIGVPTIPNMSFMEVLRMLDLDD